jgi:hypothetical protein
MMKLAWSVSFRSHTCYQMKLRSMVTIGHKGVFSCRGTLCLCGKFVLCISFRFGRHRLLQRRPSDSIVHLAIVDCTGDTVQFDDDDDDVMY